MNLHHQGHFVIWTWEYEQNWTEPQPTSGDSTEYKRLSYCSFRELLMFYKLLQHQQVHISTIKYFTPNYLLYVSA
jgi:hypothetical protein